MSNKNEVQSITKVTIKFAFRGPASSDRTVIFMTIPSIRDIKLKLSLSRRRMADWIYRSTSSRPRQQLEVSGQLHVPAALLPGERAPGTHSIGDWVGSRAGLDDVEKRRFLTLPGLELRPLGRPASRDFFNWYSGGVESNWVHSALRPPIGLLCQPRVIMMMEKLME
jgi:hypothetical protein